MAHERMLAELDRRREAAKAMGGAKKLAKRREQGQLNAQERLDALIDTGQLLRGRVARPIGHVRSGCG